MSETLLSKTETRNKLIKLMQDWGTANTDSFPCESVADCLIENGVIVPPVKVGQTVYSFCETFNTVLGYFVENLIISYFEDNISCYTYEANCVSDEFIDSIDFDFDDIGKTVFLTKEEAEKALNNKN